MTFAGFWVDGGVRKPEARHANALNHVVYQIKGRGEDSVAFFTANYKSIDSDCIWLDTTPRESLTPEELLSVAKVLSPLASKVEKRNDGPLTFWIVDDEESAVKVDWGNLTQYPPPVEPQWIRVTRENVGQYLFRECRCRDSESESWQDGHIVGWDMEDEDCLVDGDFDPVERVLKFSFVEVQSVN